MTLMKALSLFLAIACAAQGTTEVDGEIKNDSKVHSTLRKGQRKLGKNKNSKGSKNSENNTPGSGNSSGNNNSKNNSPGSSSNFSGGMAGGLDPSELVFDRAYTTVGIPVGTVGGNCIGQDTVLEVGSNFRVTQSKCGFIERKQCTNPYAVSAAKKNDPRTNERCLVGTCPGCCREFSRYVVCDINGQDRPYDPCVCSAGTFGGNPFSPEDVAPPIDVGGGTPPIDDRTPPIDGTPPGGDVGGTPPVDGTPPGGDVGGTPPMNVPSVAEVGCRPDFLGFGMGVKPPVRPANLPVGLERGECTESSHCEKTTERCCLKDFCLCGQARDNRSNCLA